MMIWFILICIVLCLSQVTQPKKYGHDFILSLLIAFITSLLLTNELKFLLFILIQVMVFTVLLNKKKLMTFLFQLKSIYLFLFSVSFLFGLFEFMTQSNLSQVILEDYFIFIFLMTSAYLLICIMNYKIKQHVTEAHWDYLFQMMPKPFIFLILVLLITKKVAFLYVMLYTNHSFDVSLIVFLALSLELFFDISFVKLIKNSYDLSLQKYEHKVLKLQYEVQASYYEQLESYQHNLRKIAHDVHHHKLVLHHLLEEKKYPEALTYLNDYSLQLEKHERHQLCAHPILNALLLKKQQQCMQHDIKFLHHIKLPASLNLSDFDLCILIGNLLDNAFEACLSTTTPHRFISITAQIINEHYTFKIENTSLSVPKKKNNLFHTSKDDTLSHGLGLSNVERVLNQYNGMINFQIQESQFHVMIAIPL